MKRSADRRVSRTRAREAGVRRSRRSLVLGKTLTGTNLLIQSTAFKVRDPRSCLSLRPDPWRAPGVLFREPLQDLESRGKPLFRRDLDALDPVGLEESPREAPRTTAGVIRSLAAAEAASPSKSHRAAEGDVVQNATNGFSRISESRSASLGRGTFR